MILQHALAVLSLAAAAAAYFLIRRFADRELQSWAGPTASALAWGGLDYAYDLPWWVIIIGFVIVCVVIHYGLRSKLQNKANKIERVEVPQAGLTLRRIPDPSNRHVALWTSAPELDEPPSSGEENGRPARTAAPWPRPSQPPPLVIALSFTGETEDEYEVVLWSQTPAELPGAFLAYHSNAVGDFRALLDTEPVTGIMGLPVWLCVRASPSDYAFHLLDYKTLSLLIDIINFRSAERDIYVYFQGRKLGIGSTRVFGESELRKILGLSAELFQKIRAAQ
ncbi:MAG: hypothetical protein HY922_13595 [Elusimicrobia bacterium]|nr:hypothetical protein [Elusimicrobiota bacterium]